MVFPYGECSNCFPSIRATKGWRRSSRPSTRSQTDRWKGQSERIFKFSYFFRFFLFVANKADRPSGRAGSGADPLRRRQPGPGGGPPQVQEEEEEGGVRQDGAVHGNTGKNNKKIQNFPTFSMYQDHSP